ncbi:MAG: hypothetical protein AMS14_08240 [Planctomycetes bacterium DG_20]|nr:MAG: hypothetical protein AMS14_08240 [Planctomycetes bacterium DG_20]
MDEELERTLRRLHEPLSRDHSRQRDDLVAAIEGRSPDKARGLKRHLALLAAAAVFVGIAVGVLWRVVLRQPSPPPPPDEPEVAFAQIKREVEEAGFAAQLLAAADLFARLPEGREYAVDRYRHIVATYPGTTAARTARQRLAAGHTGGKANEG